MRIDVTQEHIERGRHHCSWGCPIALALTEQAGLHAARVTGWTATFWSMKLHCVQIVSLPIEARNFVLMFDARRKSVAPFSFELDI